MKIYVNGDAYFLAEELTTVDQLLEKLELKNKRVAIEVNGSIIPRSRHAETVLNEGDTVEVIQAIAGG